jgi:hypothetical protein
VSKLLALIADRGYIIARALGDRSANFWKGHGAGRRRLSGLQKYHRPVRFFIARNSDLAACIHCPKDWTLNGSMPLKAVEQHEGRWETLLMAKRLRAGQRRRISTQ